MDAIDIDMKKQTRQILVFGTWLSISIFAVGWVIPTPAVAQRIRPKIINIPQPSSPRPKPVVTKSAPKTKASAKSELGWILNFQLEVKGSGEAARGGGDSDSWSINRTYTGTFALGFPVRVPKINPGMTQRQVLAAMKSAPVTWFDTEMGLGTVTKTIRVVIHDKLIQRVRPPGGELVTTTTTWDGEGYVLTYAAGQSLSFPNDKLGFNVRIALGLHGPDKLLTIVTDVGGSTVTLQEPLYYFPIPQRVTGLIESGVIQHPSDLSLPQLNSDGNTYTSEIGPFKLEEGQAPLRTVPQSHKGVKVTVRYHFNPVGKGYGEW